MARSMNKAIVLGNLGKDPELKYLPSGVAVCNFSVATSESWKDTEGNLQEKTEWHNISAFRKVAELASEYLKKGSKVLIEGKLQTRTWEKDGVTRYTTEIVAEEILFLDGKREGTGSQSEERNTTRTSSSNRPVDDDDLPF